VSLERYELGFYISEDGILHNRRSENLRSYTDSVLTIAMTNSNIILTCIYNFRLLNPCVRITFAQLTSAYA
jgi:hypothetical protein